MCIGSLTFFDFDAGSPSGVERRWRFGIARLVRCDRERATFDPVNRHARFADILRKGTFADAERVAERFHRERGLTILFVSCVSACTIDFLKVGLFLWVYES